MSDPITLALDPAFAEWLRCDLRRQADRSDEQETLLELLDAAVAERNMRQRAIP